MFNLPVDSTRCCFEHVPSSGCWYHSGTRFTERTSVVWMVGAWIILLLLSRLHSSVLHSPFIFFSFPSYLYLLPFLLLSIFLSFALSAFPLIFSYFSLHSPFFTFLAVLLSLLPCSPIPLFFPFFPLYCPLSAFLPPFSFHERWQWLIRLWSQFCSSCTMLAASSVTSCVLTALKNILRGWQVRGS